jgi:carbon-monoxide dehydrogenase large subunit
VEITAGQGGSEPVTIELRPGGSVLVRTGASPYGQGHDTTWTMLVSDRLGIPFDRIEVHHGDTDEIPEGNITGGSRSAQIVGSSVDSAAVHLVDTARATAADLLEAAVDDIVVDADGGGLHVAGVPSRTVGWAEVAEAAEEALVGVSTFRQEHATFPFGVHVSVVEVDTETGRVTVRRHVAVDDAGTILNPVTADGQVHGGLAQGIAQALLEAVVFDDDGNPLTTNFADYPVISATELPRFDRVEMETPTPHNPLGAKGIGESATVGATPAVHNAVCDALAPFGIVHVDMPCTPMRVWEALRSASPTRS